MKSFEILRSRAAYAGLAAGVVLFAAVLAWNGVGDIARAFGKAGWGIIAIVLLHLPPLWADAMGWRSLIPKKERPPRRSMIRARWIGESVNDLLPVLQMGGNVIKAWLLASRGVPVGRAGASVVVDITLVVFSQILFTLLGLSLLVPTLGSGRALFFVLTGVGIMAILLAGFYSVQRRGLFGLIVSLSRRLFVTQRWISASDRAAGIDAEVLRLYGERRVLAVSWCWHIMAWFMGVGEVWLALSLLGHPVDIGTALLFESLGQAIRTAAFAVPGGLGIQEGGYVLVGGVLGIGPGVALALSLARRVRELLLGLPGLAVWQTSTVLRAFRRKDLNNSDPVRKKTNSSGAHRWKVRRSFLIHSVNICGRLLDRPAMASFGEKHLLDSARRKAGLDDFGDPSFRDPLVRLLASVKTEARLNPIGRIATRLDLLRILVNRLRMEEDRKRHPEISEEKICRPIIITGLPRTGTTLLHNLLALDPANRVPLTWETVYPSPPPGASAYGTEPRIRLADRQIRWFHKLVKDFNRIHPVRATLPEECLVIFSHSFLSYQFETTHRLPSYLGWLEGRDLRPAYEVHRRFLQHLQWRCPGERWVLKAPAHMFDFAAMFSAYPDACVVMTHRDPIEATASNASLTATLRSAFSDEVDPFEVGPECSRRWAAAIGMALSSRDRGCAPAERFLDIYYLDLISDPAGEVRKVYSRFDLPFPEGLAGSIGEFLSRNPKDRFGKHRYSPEEFGLNPEEEKRRYARYRERFRI